MEVDKQDKELIERALTEWAGAGLLSQSKRDELSDTIHVKNTSRQIAQYFFITAISCIILAFGAIFIDEKLLERIKQYFALSNYFIAILFLAGATTWFIYCKRRVKNTGSLAYEGYMVIGGLLTLVSLVYICKEIGYGISHTGFLASVLIVIGSLAIAFRSVALWATTILSFMAWFGAFSTAYQSKYLFLGMNYPMRFTVFGMLVIAFSFLQRRIAAISAMWRITYITGLLIFFTALWGISVFGNFNDLQAWSATKQTSVILFASISALISGLTFYLGIRYQDNLTRDFGILFLLINLYTRYFEYFWDGMNKGIFFAVLAISFYAIGKYLEKRRHRNKDGFKDIVADNH